MLIWICYHAFNQKPAVIYAHPTTPHLSIPMNNESYDYDDDFEHATDAYERKDYKTAYKLLLPLAEQGDVEAQYNLGLMYDLGNGVPQDYKQAVKWFKLAAEQGEAEAQFNLAQMYYEGQGIAQDYKEAEKLFQLSAEQGDAEAQCNLGMMYV